MSLRNCNLANVYRNLCLSEGSLATECFFIVVFFLKEPVPLKVMPVLCPLFGTVVDDKVL